MVQSAPSTLLCWFWYAERYNLVILFNWVCLPQTCLVDSYASQIDPSIIRWHGKQHTGFFALSIKVELFKKIKVDLTTKCWWKIHEFWTSFVIKISFCKHLCSAPYFCMKLMRRSYNTRMIRNVKFQPHNILWSRKEDNKGMQVNRIIKLRDW